MDRLTLEAIRQIRDLLTVLDRDDAGNDDEHDALVEIREIVDGLIDSQNQ